jgi:hypothetical protein
MELKLARIARNVIVAGAAGVVLCSLMVSAAPISTIDLHSAGLLRAAPQSFRKTDTPEPSVDAPNPNTPTYDSIDPVETTAWREAELLVHDFPQITALSGLFDSKEFELSVSDDNYKKYSKPSTCVYPDSFLRTLDGGKDDCDALKPGAGESDFPALPFLAISGWALVILTVAGLYHLYGNWRVRRWLRRVGAQGGGARAANPRGIPERMARRSTSRGKPHHRRYAG